MIFYNFADTEFPTETHWDKGSALRVFDGLIGKVRPSMEEFREGQKWIMADPIHGTFYGEVIEVSDEGAVGTVIVTDDQGNIVDSFKGSAFAFQSSGEWRLLP
ncbi:MAG: hypothetical protein JO138_03815 [Acidobacteriaceae bacterium]|nr:hypothetical protein [Acidobacteriaceae bacterium]